MGYSDELDQFDAIDSHFESLRQEPAIIRTMDAAIDRLLPIAEAALPVGVSIAEAMQPAGPVGTMVIAALGKLGEDALRRWQVRRAGGN